MRLIKVLPAIIIIVLLFSSTIIAQQENMTTDTKASVYNIKRLKKSMKIDGKWDKPQWKNIKAVEITHYMGEIPKFRPTVQAKMMYDNENIYVIFRV